MGLEDNAILEEGFFFFKFFILYLFGPFCLGLVFVFSFFFNLIFKPRNVTKFLFLPLKYSLLFPAQKEKVFAGF